MPLPYFVDVQDRNGNLYKASETVYFDSDPIIGQLVTAIVYDENGMPFEVDGFLVDFECAI